MSLNLVSAQLLAANGLKHQDWFAILVQLA
ncbi:protein tldD, partial [Escherichia coli]|nr:protein tldD [Escherichia coli]